MNLGQFAGAERAIEQALAEGKLFHAWILEGGTAEARRALAEKLARKVTRYGEDVHWVSPEGRRSIKDEAMEYLQTRLQMKPLSGTYNVAVVEEAGTLTARAQNRMLKTLEEPPGPCVLLFLADSREQLLPTIRSRCLVLRAGAPADAGGGDEVAAAAAIAGRQLLAGRNYYEFVPVVAAATVSRDTAAAFLGELENWLHDRLIATPDAIPYWPPDRFWRAVRLIERANKDLAFNVGVGYCIKNLLVQLIDDGSGDDWSSETITKG